MQELFEEDRKKLEAGDYTEFDPIDPDAYLEGGYKPGKIPLISHTYNDSSVFDGFSFELPELLDRDFRSSSEKRHASLKVKRQRERNRRARKARRNNRK